MRGVNSIPGFIIWEFNSKTKASRNRPQREVAAMALKRRRREGHLGPLTFSATLALAFTNHDLLTFW